MALTSLQEKTLNRYREYRTKDITIASLMIPAIPRFTALLILAISAYVLFYTWLGLILFGATIGAFLRHLSLAMTSSKVTPIILKVIDWDAVDAMLTAQDQHGSDN